MMFAIIRNYGIPAKIVDAIKVMYDNSTIQVYLQDQVSARFNISTGVLQGDVLAPFLFIVVIDYISKISANDFGDTTHERENTGENNNKRKKNIEPSDRKMRSTTRLPDRV